MSTSVVHVLKVIGPTARDNDAFLRGVTARRRPRSKSDWFDGASAPADEAAIDRFCERMVAGCYQLPVAYYAQYVDPWSVAGSCLASVGSLHRPRRWIGTDAWILWWHLLPDRGRLDLHVRGQRRRRFWRTQTEDRWLVEHVAEAAAYFPACNRPGLVLVLLRGIGASRHDEEYRRCLLGVQARRYPRHRGRNRGPRERPVVCAEAAFGLLNTCGQKAENPGFYRGFLLGDLDGT